MKRVNENKAAFCHREYLRTLEYFVTRFFQLYPQNRMKIIIFCQSQIEFQSKAVKKLLILECYEF